MSYGKNSYKGWFKPKNPAKYNGNAENIVFRSSWELRCMKYFDDNPAVIWWSSEEMSVPYYSPVDDRMHRYFPDFIIKVQRKDSQREQKEQNFKNKFGIEADIHVAGRGWECIT